MCVDGAAKNVVRDWRGLGVLVSRQGEGGPAKLGGWSGRISVWVRHRRHCRGSPGECRSTNKLKV